MRYFRKKIVLLQRNYGERPATPDRVQTGQRPERTKTGYEKAGRRIRMKLGENDDRT